VDPLVDGDSRILAGWSGTTEDPPGAAVVTCDGRAAPQCGGTATLAGIEGGDTIDLDPGSVGFPTSKPAFPITVGGERMIVTDGYGTDALTVARSDPDAAHDPGAEVTYEPSLVDVCVPLAAACDGS